MLIESSAVPGLNRITHGELKGKVVSYIWWLVIIIIAATVITFIGEKKST